MEMEGTPSAGATGTEFLDFAAKEPTEHKEQRMGFRAGGWAILHRPRFGDKNKKSSFSGSHRSPAGRTLSAGMAKKQSNIDEAPAASPEGMMTDFNTGQQVNETKKDIEELTDEEPGA